MMHGQTNIKIQASFSSQFRTILCEIAVFGFYSTRLFRRTKS